MFNIFTGTVWSVTHYDCKTIVLVLRGIAQGGGATLHLAEELGLDRSTLLSRRHRLQDQALRGERVGLPDRKKWRRTNEQGYMTRPAWRLTHRLPMYRSCPRMDLSTSKSLARRLLNLPSAPNLLREGE